MKKLKERKKVCRENLSAVVFVSLVKNRPKLDKSSANTLKANDFETVNNLKSCANRFFWEGEIE